MTVRIGKLEKAMEEKGWKVKGDLKKLLRDVRENEKKGEKNGQTTQVTGKED